MEVFKVFDAYSLRARLFPAIIAAAPALAALALFISWKSLELSNVIATLALLVLLFAIADVARTRGRVIESKLYVQQGGKPSIVMFRRNDSTIEEGLKDRYRAFLAGQLGLAVPTPTTEEINPGAVDSFYEQCGVWLRQHTRDTKKFPLLFGENVIYGFRRNLFGVKWIAIGLNLLVVVICALLLWRNNWDWESDLGKRTIVVLVIAAMHFTYVCAAVRKPAVWDAARAYARELILSCEAFTKGPTVVKTSSRGRARKKS